MKNNKSNNVLDERQMQIRGKSTLVALIFVMVCLAVATIVRVINEDSVGWEFWVMIGVCLIMAVSGRFFGDVEAPKDMWGKPLPLGSSKKDRWVRIKNYLWQSVVFASTCCVMDVILISAGKDDVTDMEVAELIFPNLGRIETIVVTALIAVVSAFLVSFVFEYIIGERFKVKKYNDLMAKLDAEDEEE